MKPLKRGHDYWTLRLPSWDALPPPRAFLSIDHLQNILAEVVPLQIQHSIELCVSRRSAVVHATLVPRYRVW